MRGADAYGKALAQALEEGTCSVQRVCNTCALYMYPQSGSKMFELDLGAKRKMTWSKHAQNSDTKILHGEGTRPDDAMLLEFLDGPAAG